MLRSLLEPGKELTGAPTVPLTAPVPLVINETQPMYHQATHPHTHTVVVLVSIVALKRGTGIEPGVRTLKQKAMSDWHVL